MSRWLASVTDTWCVPRGTLRSRSRVGMWLKLIAPGLVGRMARAALAARKGRGGA